MARSIPIRLDSFQWPTQAAAEKAFQQILKSSGYGLNERITNPVHDLMLREVLDRHPYKKEKMGKGVDYFFIGLTSDGSSKVNVRADATGIWIRQIDGTKVEFSYIKAIRNNTPKSDAKESLRTAVDAQRLAYRDSRFAATTPAVSDLSGRLINEPDQAQVIYLNPTWGQLTFRFAESEGGWDKLPVHAGYGSPQIGGRLVDPAIEARWLAFHGRHARLGIALAGEAASRPRDNEEAWTPTP